MLKIKNILLLLSIIITMLLFPKNVQATENETNITSVEIKAPESGIYGLGQKITLRINFDKAIKGNMPKIEVCFANDNNTKTLSLPEVIEPTKYIEYIYEIASGDNGELKINKIIYQDLYDTNGNVQDIKVQENEIKGNRIIAETTISRSNMNDISFEWISDNEGNNNGLGLKLKNAVFIDGYSYYIYLSHDKDEKLSLLDFSSINTDKWKGINTTSNEVNVTRGDNIVATNGDIYAWICEVDNKYHIPKILVSGKKIERKFQLPIGSRLRSYFFEGYTSTFVWETIGNDERNINVKIGTVKDKNILKSIKNGDVNCLSNLLSYAKSAESIYTGTVKVGRSEAIVKEMNLQDEDYYYVYMELEDENGKYYPVEDVSLYQAIVGERVVQLCDYLDANFKWNLDSESSNSEVDIKKYISFPIIIFDGKGSVDIHSGVEIDDYTMYYQFVEVSDEVFNKLNSLNEKYKNNELTYEEYFTQYNENLSKYDETKWEKTEDGSFEIKSNSFEGTKKFVLWVKLVMADKTVYENEIYAINSNGSATNNPERNDKLKEDDTTASGKLPQTGVEIVAITTIILFIIIGTWDI